MGDIESGRKQLSYPVHLDTDTYDSDGNFMIYILASNLGGVTLSKDKSILIGAEAINLNYFLDSTNEENDSFKSDFVYFVFLGQMHWYITTQGRKNCWVI